MYVHYKSSFRDNGTKTRWIVNINVRHLWETLMSQYVKLEIMDCINEF